MTHELSCDVKKISAYFPTIPVDNQVSVMTQGFQLQLSNIDLKVMIESNFDYLTHQAPHLPLSQEVIDDPFPCYTRLLIPTLPPATVLLRYLTHGRHYKPLSVVKQEYLA